LDGDVTLALTEDSVSLHSGQSTDLSVDDAMDAATEAWRARVSGQFEAYAIDATHLSVVVDPAAGAIARIISNCFEHSDPFSVLESPNLEWLKPIGRGEGNG
jgi:hypothetical protein